MWFPQFNWQFVVIAYGRLAELRADRIVDEY